MSTQFMESRLKGERIIIAIISRVGVFLRQLLKAGFLKEGLFQVMSF
jgi:hypothetical protein